MRGQGAPNEVSGKSPPSDSLAALVHMLAGNADGQGAKGIDAPGSGVVDGATATTQTALAAQAEGGSEDDAAAGGAAVAGDNGEAKAVAGDEIDVDVPETGQPLPGAAPVAGPGENPDAAQSVTPEGEETIPAAAAVPIQGAGADGALQPSRRDGGPDAVSPVAGDAPRAPQGNNPAAASTAAKVTATGDAAASGSNPDAQGQGQGQGEGEAGAENRSGVAQEAMRRALGSEAGGDRAAMAPGDGAQATRQTGEQMARMMQIGAETSATQAQGASQGVTQAAAEAGTTANGQANAAGQAGTAATQTNGSVLINTPLSAVPMTLGMKAMGGTSRFDIRLDPAELGRIAVSLDIDDEGTVKARLVVDRVETLQLLQRDARTLERAFEQAGLKPSEDGIDLSLRDDGDRHAGRGGGDAEEDSGRGSGDGHGRDGDESEKGLAAAEIRALARETLLARQALRRALGGVDLSI